MPLLLPLVLHAGVFLGPPMVGDAPATYTPPAVQAERTVAALTRTRAARAERSRELDDDRALRDQVLSYGRLMSWSRPMESACLARVLAMDTVDPQHADWQVDASRRLMRVAPGHAAVSPERMVTYTDNWYRAASSAERPVAGEAHIEALIVASAQAERRGEMTQGIVLLRDAQRVAREVNSPYAKILEDEQRRLAGLSRYDQQLDNLQRQLERRSDARTASTAAIRFAIERLDYDTALSLAEQAEDPVLVHQLALASGDAAALEPVDALGLSQWFLDQAKGPALSYDHARLLACYEARFYAHCFLNSYPKRDVLRLRGQEIADELDERIGQLEPPAVRRPAGSWHDLLSAVIAPRANQPGSLVGGEHLRVRNNTLYLNASVAAIGADVPAEYELRFTVTRTHANDRNGMSLRFPVGDGGGLVVLGDGGEGACRLEKAAVAKALEGFRFPEDTAVSFVLSVRERGSSRVSVKLYAEGREVIDWTGSKGQLSAGEAPPKRIGRGLVISCGTSYEITNLAYRRAAAE